MDGLVIIYRILKDIYSYSSTCVGNIYREKLEGINITYQLKKLEVYP